MNRSAYTASVTSRPTLVAGTAGGLLAATAVWWIDAPVWTAVLVAAVTTPVAVALSTVRLAVGAERVVLGWGPSLLPARSIPRSTVREAWVTNLRWPQVFGLGVRPARRLTRLTVRAGPTLCLRLGSGELVRVSVPDPHAAARLLVTTAPSRRTP